MTDRGDPARNRKSSLLPARWRSRARIFTAGGEGAEWLAVMLRPEPPIDEVVDHYWAVIGAARCPPARLSPVPGIELVVSLSDSLHVSGPEGTSSQMLGTSWLEGPRDAWIESAPTGSTSLIGVRFRPAGAFPLLGPQVRDLTNRIVDADLALGRGIESLRQRLGDEPDLGRRFDQLDAFMRDGHAGGRKVDPRVSWACRSLATIPCRHRIGELSEALGISRQRFIDIFKTHVGTTPKRFARTARLNHLVRHVATAVTADWPSLALDFGFFDQAHLVREFGRMAGCTPSQFLRRRDGLTGTVVMGS